METTIFLCTLMVCLVWIFITHWKLRSSRTSSTEMWKCFTQAAERIAEMIEYQEHLKHSKDEKKDSPDSDT